MPKKNSSDTSNVIDLCAYRSKRISAARRSFQRYYLENEVSAFIYGEEGAEISINLSEVGEGGIAFFVPLTREAEVDRVGMGKPRLRLFLTPSTFIEIPVSVIHRRRDNGRICVGCEVFRTVPAYEAYLAWLGFFRAYAKHGNGCGPAPESA